MVEKANLIKVNQLKLDNKLFEKEIYSYNEYAKNHGLLQSKSNIGGDHVTVRDTQNWPQFSLFNEQVANYCIKNIPNSRGYYYWYNINYTKCYNAMHSHGRSDENMIKCLIYYVKVPEDSGDLIFLIDGEEVSHTPKEGDFIEFDTNLMHGVEPNFSNEIRISIAINVYNFYNTRNKEWKAIENQ